MRRFHLVFGTVVAAMMLLLAFCGEAVAERKEYDIMIEQQAVNITGAQRPAMTVNGGIPGPTLRFKEGDHAVIRVRNKMDVETSIHWHGLLLPNEMDGVPYVTYPPIAPGSEFIYEFDIRQSGTYWYHSHTMAQEQSGVYGSLVIEPRRSGKYDSLRDHVVMLSDWTDEDPHTMLHTLKRGSADWYSLKKGMAQSILGAARVGKLGDYFSRELQRMPPMDLSDVFYDRFLLNGGSEQQLDANPGEKIRLRVIDGSASTYFYTQFAGGPMTIITADGQAVEPIDKNRILVAVAETYDVIITVPAAGSYEFRATAQDGSGKASLWIGSGVRHAAADIPKANLYITMGGLSLGQVFALTPGGSVGIPTGQVDAGRFDAPGMNGMQEMEQMNMPSGAADNSATMKADGEMSPSDHSGMTMGKADDSQMAGMPGMQNDAGDKTPKHAESEMPTAPGTWLGLMADDLSSQSPLAEDGMGEERPWAPYDELRALSPTAFESHRPIRDVRLTLDEDMTRYVWSLNNKTLSESDSIEIKQGEVVRFIMINRTMMHHPMHLHGHFFRVVNKQGGYSPLKHTVDVAPMSTTVIEFKADEFGDWFFHCHLLYHMESGMARVVHYDGYQLDPVLNAVRSKLYDDDVYLFGQVDAMSQMAQGLVTLSNSRHIFSTEWKTGWGKVDGVAWEAAPIYDYYLNRFSTVFAGMDLEGTDNIEKHEGVFGFRYLLPLNISSRTWVDTAGDVQLSVGKSLELTPRLQTFAEFEYDTQTHQEIRAGASYLLSRDLSLIGQWHSEFGWGGGLQLRF